jgi:Peptidase M15
MGYEFMVWLDKVRDDADVPMVISSSKRSKAYNAKIGGATNSAHTDELCEAVDIREAPRDDDPSWNYSRFRIVKAALDNGCTRIGLYADGSIHLDRTEHKRPAPRMWRVVK